MTRIVAGIVALGLGIWALVMWWGSVLHLVKGLIPIALVVGGALAIASYVMGREKEIVTFPEEKHGLFRHSSREKDED